MIARKVGPPRVKTGDGKGRRIDQLSTMGNPMYATGAYKPTDKLGDTATNASWGQHGWHYTHPTKGEQTREAILKDKPTQPGRGKNSSQTFETAALAIEGKQKDTYMGSVEWGWEVDGSGTFKKKPFKLIAKGDPTKGFMAAAKQWNKSKARGTIKTSANPTSVHKWSGGFVVDFTVPKDTTVELAAEGNFIDNDKNFNKVEIKSGTKAGSVGFVLVTDMKDQGDGKDTVDLPVK